MPGDATGGDGARREFVLTLLAGALGAGIVLLAAAQRWAHASFAPAPPLPAFAVTLTGKQLAPAAEALGLAALACLAAVIATRGVARRFSGGILAVLGALAAVSVVASAGHAHVAATAANHAPAAAGTGAPHVAMAGFPWWAAGAAGSLLIVAAGAGVASRGHRWPAMSSKYDRGPVRIPRSGDGPGISTDRFADGSGAVGAFTPTPGEPPEVAADDQARAWNALDQGMDPTVPPPRG